MKNIEKLRKRITEMGLDIELYESSKIKRTYAGKNQKSQGAWSWFVNIENGLKILGSPEPLKEILSSKYLTYREHFGDIELISLDEPEKPKEKNFGYTWVKVKNK